MDPQRLLTATLRDAPWGAAVSRIMSAALQAVEPASAVQRHLQRNDARLIVGTEAYDLHDFERVFIVGVGKASVPMSRAAAGILGPYLAEGLVIVKGEEQAAGSEGEESEPAPVANPQSSGARPRLPFPFAPFLAPPVPFPMLPLPFPLVPLPFPSSHPSLTVLSAGHPLPDTRSIEASQRVVSLLEQATARDLVLVLISGGGSALLTLPVPGITLDDIQELTSLLLRCGASIDEINTLRKHLDRVKGGGLARLAEPASVATLILSDVVGNPLDMIASGPTVPDSTTFADAYAVLERYNLRADAPPAIVDHLRAGLRGEVPETPKSDDPLFAYTQHVLVGSNQQAVAAARQAAQEEGFEPLVLTTAMKGEARVVGQLLSSIARELATTGCRGYDNQPILPRPACIIVGGETTVTLQGNGKGGRNQELALAAVRGLAGLSDVALVTLATDGGDGPTDAAGAVVTGETLARARALGLNPDSALANNDAYPFFAALDDLLLPGPTETNVNDLAFVFAF